MYQIFPLFIVMAGLFFSTLFQRLRIPLVIALIAAGITIGPHGLDILQPDLTLEFIGRIGLVFLIFIAGMEIKLSGFSSVKKEVFLMTALNGFIPFLTGVILALALGYSIPTALLLGIIFVSSSLAVTSISLESLGIHNTRLGKTIIGSAITLDVISLIALFLLLRYTTSAETIVPFPIFILIAGSAIFFLHRIVPKIRWLFYSENSNNDDLFQQELRFIITVLIGTVVVFEFLNLTYLMQSSPHQYS